MIQQDMVSRPEAPLFTLGLGCERGAPVDEVIALAEQALRDAGIDCRALACIVTLDVRLSEPAIVAAAGYFSVPLKVFPVAALEAETPRLKTPSNLVFAITGCHGVAEAAALAAAGETSDLIVPKLKSAHATAAVAGCFVESNQTVAEFPSIIDSGSSHPESIARHMPPVVAEALA